MILICLVSDPEGSLSVKRCGFLTAYVALSAGATATSLTPTYMDICAVALLSYTYITLTYSSPFKHCSFPLRGRVQI